ncbi:MAG: methyltransferase domain-containing protein [Thermoplasmata archaeon]|nr:MAG: methyltransferase domain-containing protein [Thermoplasmata archaeon]
MNYDEFFSTPLGKKILEEEARYVAKNLEGEIAVSIGCGTGIIERRIMEIKKVEIVGVELDDEMIKMASKRIEVIKADATALPFKNASFDNAIFITSLEFIEDYRKTIDEAYRILKKEGKIVVILLNTSSSYFKERYERGGYIKRNIKHLDVNKIEEYIRKRFSVEKEEIIDYDEALAIGMRGKKFHSINSL